MRLLSLLLGLSSIAAAGFLPLIQDRPKRDNPNDPRVRPLALPIADLPTVTDTPTPPPSCGGPELANYAGFESGTDSFSAQSGGGFTAPPLVAGTPACQGSQALCGTATWTYGGSPVKIAFLRSMAATNWSGRNLAAKAYMPAGLSGTCAKLYLKLGGAYAYAQGACINSLPSGGWVDLSLDVDAAASAASASPADVREFGVEFYSDAAGNSDGLRTVCLDAVFLLGGPTPTVTRTFTASPTVALGTPTATPTASPSPSPTATPLPACGDPSDTSSVATFEGGAESWTSEDYAGPPPYTLMSMATMSNPVCLGAQSLCGLANWVHGGSEVKVAFKKNFASQDWSGSALSARLHFQAGVGTGTSAKLYVKTGAGYAYHDGPSINAPAGAGWVLLTLDLAAVATANDVREVGVDVYSPNGQPDGMFTLCLDGVNR